MTDTKVVKDIRELTRSQLEVIVNKAEIKAKGVFQRPRLDIDAIKARADQLDAKSPIKADVYLLIAELTAKAD
jgi:hypothetical protein